ncbi:replication initiator protein A [Cetobacterium sp. 2A]|uniref:replication initiator protein A n=1 Tax=Cetobacterium sp. 2A TaxID=2754723 RepID=UPI00163CA81E|nr:replication initiator protein A [Cetobacterium sp. 2A]MBC2855466.1 replication initiator protein A [Cetobacterium sp. 2A]
MRAIKKEDLDNINYYQVPKWLMDIFIAGKISQGAFKTYILMYDRLRLSSKKGWIDKTGEVYIRYSYDEMQKDLDCSRQTVSNNLKDLEKLKLIDKKKGFNSSSIFYLNIYDGSLENFTSKDVLTSKETLTTDSLESLTASSLEDLDASKNNFSKNNSIRTTTKQDNINYIELTSNEIENSSSSLNLKIKEIKTYLHEEIKDITTCKNIMFLVENRYLPLEKIKEVVNHANKYQKGSGFIYKALEQNWTLAKEDKVLKPGETVRGSKVNREAIESNILAEKEKEVALELRENLNDFFYKLPEKERIDIENKAYEIALEQYGHATAKVMARTKTKYEILKRYHSVERGA